MNPNSKNHKEKYTYLQYNVTGLTLVKKSFKLEMTQFT